LSRRQAKRLNREEEAPASAGAFSLVQIAKDGDIDSIDGVARTTSRCARRI